MEQVKVAEKKAKKVEEQIEYDQGFVLYSDGGSRPNGEKGGWGIHGYLYSTQPPKKGSGLADYILTANGYVSITEAAEAGSTPEEKEMAAIQEIDPTIIKRKKNITEVTPLHYVSGYGSFDIDVSNNLAELVGCQRAMAYALEFPIKNLVILTDSEYVCKGLAGWVDKWKSNNWLKTDGTAPANVTYWKQLLEERDKLKERGVKVQVQWVKGHSDKIIGMDDNIGNIIADRHATAGVMASREGKLINDISSYPATGFWSYTPDRHPFIANRRMYYNTNKDYIQAGVYYLGDHGKVDDTCGKRIADGAFSIVWLKKPDPILEMLRDYQVRLAEGKDSVVIARLDKIYQSETHQDLVRFGTQGVITAPYPRLDLLCLDKEPLALEMEPAKLIMRIVDATNDLERRIAQYLNKDDDLTITDLTPIIYESNVKTDKKKVTTTTLKLKPAFNVGFAALPVEANYMTGEGLKTAKITLTLGIDLLDRNSLKRIEEMNPEVTLITWMESPKMFRYATIIKANEDIGIWAGVYSNTRFID